MLRILLADKCAYRLITPDEAPDHPALERPRLHRFQLRPRVGKKTWQGATALRDERNTIEIKVQYRAFIKLMQTSNEVFFI